MDRDCQEGRGVITLSLSNSFARKDFNFYTLAGLGNSTSVRETVRPATPGSSAVCQEAAATKPSRPSISHKLWAFPGMKALVIKLSRTSARASAPRVASSSTAFPALASAQGADCCTKRLAAETSDHAAS